MCQKFAVAADIKMPAVQSINMQNATKERNPKQ
jgi:hypothetical protein